jgi:prepilin-type N-terminal cleavage/methylation domain-containing protein
MARLRSGTRAREDRGFSFIELLVALAATVIVMGVVFGLLAQGSGVHNEEMERSDLQAQARAALQMLSQDVLIAGGDLPPEIPAFRSVQSPLAVRQAEIEIVGNFEDDAGSGGAIPVVSFDGRFAKLGGEPTRFVRGDLVLVYDDQPTDGKWIFALVESVTSGSSPELALMTAASSRIDDVNPPAALPATIDSYNRPTPESGFVTPVTVIGYGLEAEGNAPDTLPNSLWRQVNWGERVDVAHIEVLEIRYFVGGTVSDMVAPTPKAGPLGGPSVQSQWTRGPRNRTDNNLEKEVPLPPDPQPIPSMRIEESDLIRGVRISVTSRSKTANLRGSTLAEGQAPDEDSYLREVVTTRVAPRNLLIQAERRMQQSDTPGGSDPDPTDPPDPRRPRNQ